jgi:serine/threonine protein kinase
VRTPAASFGPWTVVDHLGEGGTSTVYRARRGDQVAALKVLRVNRPLRPGQLDAAWSALNARLTALAQIEHPAVLRIQDWGRDDDGAWLWIVMQELVGDSLAGRMGPPDEVQRWLLGLASGLAAAHAAGVLHGDIKPENLFIEPVDRAVMVDFALPLRPDEDTPFAGAVPLGSPRWLAPECFDGGPASTAADVYALGQSAHEVLTGAAAFSVTGRGPGRLITLREAKLRGAALDPGPEVPEPLRGVIVRCTDPDPARRPTASELASPTG